MSHRHRSLVAVAAVACFLLSLVASSASAAPSFSVALSHAPSEIHRGDEFVSYKATVKNTAPPTFAPGETATCNTGSWTPTAEATKPAFSFQWLLDGAPIAGKTAATYVIAAGDQGHSLQCQVTGTNANAAAAAVSAPLVVAPVPAVVPPASANALAGASRPAISVPTTTAAGSQIFCNAPTNWTGEGVTWSFQWLRNGVPASGPTSSPGPLSSGYTIQASDVAPAAVLQCKATATNAGGGATVISNSLNTSPAPSNPPGNAVAANPTVTGPNWTAGTINFFLSLPEGLHIAKAGSGCETTSFTTVACSTSSVLAPGASTAFNFDQVWIEQSAPSTVVAIGTANGGGAKAASGNDVLSILPQVPFGISVLEPKVLDEFDADYTQAGGHPFSAEATFEVPTRSTTAGNGPVETLPVEAIKDGLAELPPGLVGNPQAATVCQIPRLLANTCDPSAAIGGVHLILREVPTFVENQPVYRVPAEPGYAAEFGFKVAVPSYVVRVGVRTDGDYGINVHAPLIPQAPPLVGANFKFCGFGSFAVQAASGLEFKGCRKKSEALLHAEPVVTLPTNCSDPEPKLKFSVSSWKNPGAVLPNGNPDYSDPNWKRFEAAQPQLTGCEALVEAWTDPETGPELDLQPDNTNADTPAGYTARLHVDNKGLTEIDGLSASHLRDIAVTLPEGVSLNPAVGAGVQTCSEEQMGLISLSPLHFSTDLPDCPPAAKLGVGEIISPLLEKPLSGSIYLAAQDENPFGSDYAIYFVVEDPDEGIVIKLAGKVVADAETGQIRTFFTENPQLPFEDLTLKFFGGYASALANPTVCGTVSTNTELTPWAAEDPANPRPDEIAHFAAPITIGSGPNGAPCANSPQERPFNLSVTAGSQSATAGATSPFVTRITRPDGSQELSELSVSSPPGYSAYLRGIPSCTQAEIESARGKTGVGEQAHPSCPAASRLGSIETGAGPGAKPLFTPGDVYLGGPYRGAPLSLVTITPAVAGGSAAHPAFDLGNVVVQVPIFVDRQTAGITAKTDALPEILNGIPLRIRDIRVNLDRPNWGLNPTSCEPSQTSVSAKGNSGASTKATSPFQMEGCQKLSFGPRLKAHLTGGIKRGDHPAFTAEVNFPAGQANTKDVQVTLPHSEFLDQAHINTICTRVQAAANACPAGSIYGFAEAETPLLDGKLTGPVFLKSSDHQLPDLAIALRGPDSQPVEVEFAGRIDSVKAQIRNTIEGLPDVPVTKFVLKMKGGRKGLLVNSRNLCKGKVTRMTVKMVGQNNKRFDSRPKLRNSCGKQGKKTQK